jgi:hypothetical protein
VSARYPDATAAHLGLLPVLSPNDPTALPGTLPKVAPPVTTTAMAAPTRERSRMPLVVTAAALLMLGTASAYWYVSHSSPKHASAPMPSASAEPSAVVAEPAVSVMASASASSAVASSSVASSATAMATTRPKPSATTASTTALPPGEAAVHLQGIRVQGRPVQGSIDRTLRANFPRFRACYETALKSNATLAGTMRVQLVVGQEGNVLASPYVDHNWGTLNDGPMETCVLGVTSSLVFPKPESAVVNVGATFDFTYH